MIKSGSPNPNTRDGARTFLARAASLIAPILLGVVLVTGVSLTAGASQAWAQADEASVSKPASGASTPRAASQAPKLAGHAKTAKPRSPGPSVKAKTNNPNDKNTQNDDSSPFPQFSANHGPISITADSLSLDYKNNTVRFKGHVRVVQAGGVLTTNSLLVKYTQAHEIDQAIADGNVRMSQGGRWVTSDHAVLNQTDHTIALTGHPVAHNGADQVTGSKITVYLQTGQSVVDGDARAVFFPRSTKSGDNQSTRRATGGVQAAGGNQVSADPAP
ncbi:MAG: LptA/OstA family protein [Candidatus Binataceae bacterium]